LLLQHLIRGSLLGFVEKLGFLINPLVLKIVGENNQLLVFYFHGLYKSLEQRDLNHIDPQSNMTVNQFSDFLDYFLNHNYSFINSEELLAGPRLDGRYAMVTFDDGYFNNLLAIDVLRKFRIPAVFFITAKNIIENRSFWWDIIFKYRFKHGNSLKKIQNEQTYLKQFKDEYIDDYIIKNFGIKAFIPWSDIDRPLTEPEVGTLKEFSLAEIGNHTYNHSILTNCSRNEIEEEYNASNKFLASLTGSIPISTAFPNGYYNQLVLSVTEEAGFKLAFSIVPQKNHLPLPSGNLICLNRFMANNNIIGYYGSFYRLGYTPGSLYSDFKRIANPFTNKNI
jgi:peptidoglycan/xylan/chitin deacetylase (PgdA/CDA1 family)